MAPQTTLEEWLRFEDAVESIDLGPIDTEKSWMEPSDLKFLLHFLREKRPAKVLDLGVCDGGTTRILLSELSPAATVHSVDIALRCPRDRSRATGYAAAEWYAGQRERPDWRTYFGRDVSQCLREIGGDIDFCILDTSHRLPGEILSYVAVLPYLQDGATLILHDLVCQTWCCWKREPWEQLPRLNLSANELLFGAIQSKRKSIYRPASSRGRLANIAAVTVDKALALESVETVLGLLCLPWAYWPGRDVAHATAEIVRERYPRPIVELFEDIMRFNARRVEKNLRDNVAFLLAKYGRLAIWGHDEASLRELAGEETLRNPRVRLVHDRPGLKLAGREVESPEAIRQHGLRHVLLADRLPEGEEEELFETLAEAWGVEKVFPRPLLESEGDLRAKLDARRTGISHLISRWPQVAFWGINRRFKELMDEDLVAPANVRLVDSQPGGVYGNKKIEDPEIIRREGIKTVIVSPAAPGPESAAALRRELAGRHGVTKAILLDDLCHHYGETLREEIFKAEPPRFLSRFSQVAFWGIGRQFRELVDEDLVAPANIRLVDRRPGGVYGNKTVEGPEIIEREGIETVIIPSRYLTADGRDPAGEIRRELESRYRVKNIIHLDELFRRPWADPLASRGTIL